MRADPPAPGTAASPVAAIVLAAGESTRLGTFKPLLCWPPADGEPLVAYQVRQLREAGASAIIVVVGHRAADVAPVATAAGAVVAANPGYAEGKSSSVRVGVAASPDDYALLIIGVDQPRPASLLRALIAEPPPADTIVIPTCDGRRGHPPLFGPDLRAELLAVQEETFGLRAVLRRHAAAIRHVETSDPITLVNLNTVEDAAAARELLAL